MLARIVGDLLGNPQIFILKVNLNKKEAIKEYAKCIRDYSYYAERYAKTFNEQVQKKVDFRMFKQQRELIANLMQFRFNIVPKSRQSGISSTTALFQSCNMMFNRDRKVLTVAHKRDGAENFLAKIVEFIEDRPTFIGDDNSQSGIYIKSKSQSRIVLSNGSEARAFASSSEGLRSFTATDLVMDEAAFIPNAKKLWTATSPTLSTGGRATFISTPNGLDELFYKTYDQALREESNFHITYIRWWRDERYNRGLIWSKKGEDDITEFEDEERMMELYKSGWAPSSPWFEEQRKTLNNDRKRIAQEYQIEFIGSSDTVVPSEFIRKIEQEQVIDPITKDERYNDIWYYKMPKEGKSYLVSSDVSSGTAEDSSSFSVIDTETYEVCADYKAKIYPEDLARVLSYIGTKYNNACVAVDVQGGWGYTTVVKMVEYDYPNIYRSYMRKKDAKEAIDKANEGEDDGKEYGFLTTVANRNLMVEEFVHLIRESEIELPSLRLLQEMKVFVYKENGKADHMKGYHDDLLFSYLMNYYILGFDYKTVKESRKDTEMMLALMLGLNKLKSNKDDNDGDIDRMLWGGSDAAPKSNFKLPKHGFII